MCSPLPCPRCRTGVAVFDPGHAANDVCTDCRRTRSERRRAMTYGSFPSFTAVVEGEQSRTLFGPPLSEIEPVGPDPSAEAYRDIASWYDDLMTRSRKEWRVRPLSELLKEDEEKESGGES